jgi:hypothetical protein
MQVATDYLYLQTSRRHGSYVTALVLHGQTLQEVTVAWLGSTFHKITTRLRRNPKRLRLERMATRYASQGWDVVPGSYLRGSRFDCGRIPCQTLGCHPALDNWEKLASHDPVTIRNWWKELPFSVLLATGRAFDVLEVPEVLARPVVEQVPVRTIGGPVALAPGRRWMFLVRPGHLLAPQLAARADVVLHGRGSWVPAPPTRHPEGPVVWRISPQQVGFMGADPLLIQSLLVAARRQRNCAFHGQPENLRYLADLPDLSRIRVNTSGYYDRPTHRQIAG